MRDSVTRPSCGKEDEVVDRRQGAVHPAMRERSVRALLDDLIRQRRRLEATATEPDLLAANRLSIVYWQQELSHCMAERNRVDPAA
jgi:hypothetical protein